MKNPLLAERYARALFDATGGKADIADLSRRVGSLEPDQLRRPTLGYEMLVKALGADPNSSELKNLLKLLCRRKRHWLLPEILLAYETRVEKSNGIARARVLAPVEPDAETRKKLEGLVAGITSAKTVRLDVEVEPELLSGFVVRVGDNLIDASGRTRLEEFRSRF